MRAALIAYIAGLVLAAASSQPQRISAIVLAALALCIVIFARNRPAFSRKAALLAGCALLGFAWHLNWAAARLDAQIGGALEGVDMWVTGTVRSLPRRFDEIQQFQFNIEQSDSGFDRRKVLLNHYGDEEILAGRAYRLEVRLNRPRGLANPGAFDYEAWLFQQGITARGYVRGGVEMLPDGRAAWLASLRGGLKAKILGLVEDPATAGIIVALVLGDAGGLSDEQWELFQQTGTNHLFVISGLHIGLICLLAYGLTLTLIRRFPPLMLFAPAQKLALIPALAAAAGYGAISGFGLPAQRAVVMAAVFMLASLLNLKQPVSLRYLLAMAVVLSLNPLSFLGMGFWLSFMAVGALLLVHNPAKEAAGAGAWLAGSLRTQLAVAAALLAPLLLWTGQVSLLAPLVNLAAIPLLGLCVVPLCLLATFCLVLGEQPAGILFHAAGMLLHMLLWALGKVVALGSGHAVLTAGSMDAPSILLLAAGSLLLLLPGGFPGRRLAGLLLFPLLFVPARAPREDLLRLHVLDVGQGLAAIVQTRRHVLLYDTGASFSPDASMGDRIILPVLDRMGVDKLDAVVISHSDDDHSGGFAAIAGALPVDRLYSSYAIAAAPGVQYACREFINWRWDDVEFRFLHPDAPREKDNDNSCVLQIRAADFSVLLPGDIEAGVEKELAAGLRAELQSEVLVAAHHGSNTSSSWPFLKMVDPDHIVFAAGYRNAFGHPSRQVVERAGAFTSNLPNTSALGMISFVLPEAGAVLRVSSFRRDHPRYWRDAAKASPGPPVLH